MAKQPQRMVHGKSGSFIGKPHRTAPPTIAPQAQPGAHGAVPPPTAPGGGGPTTPVIPVDSTRMATPITGVRAGRRKS